MIKNYSNNKRYSEFFSDVLLMFLVYLRKQRCLNKQKTFLFLNSQLVGGREREKK